MLHRLIAHARANTVAYLALFVALGGTSYAAATIGSADVIDDSLLTDDVKNGTLLSADYAANSVTFDKIRPGHVFNSDLAPNAVTSAKIANGAVTGDDVLETSLGKVGDADTVDGKHASELEVDVARATIQPGCSGTCFGAPEGISWSTPTEADVALGSPARSTVARNFAVSIVDQTQGYPGASFTLRVGSADSALSCSFTSNLQGGCTNTSTSVTIPAGSPVSIEVQGGTQPGEPAAVINPIAVGWESRPAG